MSVVSCVREQSANHPSRAMRLSSCLCVCVMGAHALPQAERHAATAHSRGTNHKIPPAFRSVDPDPCGSALEKSTIVSSSHTSPSHIHSSNTQEAGRGRQPPAMARWRHQQRKQQHITPILLLVLLPILHAVAAFLPPSPTSQHDRRLPPAATRTTTEISGDAPPPPPRPRPQAPSFLRLLVESRAPQPHATGVQIRPLRREDIPGVEALAAREFSHALFGGEAGGNGVEGLLERVDAWWLRLNVRWAFGLRLAYPDPKDHLVGKGCVGEWTSGVAWDGWMDECACVPWADAMEGSVGRERGLTPHTHTHPPKKKQVFVLLHHDQDDDDDDDDASPLPSIIGLIELSKQPSSGWPPSLLPSPPGVKRLVSALLNRPLRPYVSNLLIDARMRRQVTKQTNHRSLGPCMCVCVWVPACCV